LESSEVALGATVREATLGEIEIAKIELPDGRSVAWYEPSPIVICFETRPVPNAEPTHHLALPIAYI